MRSARCSPVASPSSSLARGDDRPHRPARCRRRPSRGRRLRGLPLRTARRRPRGSRRRRTPVSRGSARGARCDAIRGRGRAPGLRAGRVRSAAVLALEAGRGRCAVARRGPHCRGSALGNDRRCARRAHTDDRDHCSHASRGMGRRRAHHLEPTARGVAAARSPRRATASGPATSTRWCSHASSWSR